MRGLATASASRDKPCESVFPEMRKAELLVPGDVRWFSADSAHARNATSRIEWRPDIPIRFPRNLTMLSGCFARSRFQISRQLDGLLVPKSQNSDLHAKHPALSLRRICPSRQGQILRPWHSNM